MSFFRRVSLVLCFLTLVSLAAYPQGVRFDSIALGVQSPSSQNAVVVKNPVINVCSTSATSVATCATNRITTYSSLTLATPCAATAQVVLTNTSTCVNVGDNYGNFGFFVPAGTFKFSVAGTNAIS